jgi:hypothetical protein
MIENNLEVGPFTPQEIEEICEKLKSRGVSFELLKDEASEKSEMKSDYLNVVNKAEFRLEPYLGQVFYLRLSLEDFNKHKPLFQEYGMATNPIENPKELDADITEVVRDSKEQKRLQGLLAGALIVLALSAWIYSML